VKETSFRIDGVFIPPDADGIIYFCEIQFQPDELLYERMISEIAIYTYRHRSLFSDWRAVAIYPSRNMEQSSQEIVTEMLASGRITPIYLDELERNEALSTGLGLMVLTTLEGDLATAEARRLIGQARGSQDIIDLVSTIVLYKFNTLSRDEVDLMLGIELQQTRVYQEAMAEGEVRGLERGRTEGEQGLVLKQLIRKLGKIDPEVQARVNSLSIENVEFLGESLLDFTQMADLLSWLDGNISLTGT
jgi:predicted transposase/invertase (TIGR01784 family)